jgi:hypothetical protein
MEGQLFCPAIARPAGLVANNIPPAPHPANHLDDSHPDVVKFKPTALKLSKAYVPPN